MRGWGWPSPWWSPGGSYTQFPPSCVTDTPQVPSSSLPSNTPTPNWATHLHHQALGQHPGNMYANPHHWAPSFRPCPHSPRAAVRASLQNSGLLLCAKIWGSFPSHLRKSTTRPGRPALPSWRPLPWPCLRPAEPPALQPLWQPPHRQNEFPALGSSPHSMGSHALSHAGQASPVATSRVMAEVSRSTGRSMVLPSGVGVSVRLCNLRSSRSSWRWSRSSRSSSRSTCTSAGGRAALSTRPRRPGRLSPWPCSAPHPRPRPAQHPTRAPAQLSTPPEPQLSSAPHLSPPEPVALLAAPALTHSLVLRHPPRQWALVDQLLLGDVQVLEAGRMTVGTGQGRAGMTVGCLLQLGVRVQGPLWLPGCIMRESWAAGPREGDRRVGGAVTLNSLSIGSLLCRR